MDKFEEWFASQNFYTNMLFIHGDGFFVKDGDVYRVLPVQMTWEAWQSRQAEIDELNQLYLKAQHQEVRHRTIAQDALALVDEKDKRIEELERSCISYKNQRDDNAQKLMVKSIHYNSIQEELAKLKDRLELAHHLASQSAWSSLKQLKKVVKALRGEHANS